MKKEFQVKKDELESKLKELKITKGKDLISSLNSLADELNIAKDKLEKHDMENEIKSLKKRMAKLEKDSKDVEFYRRLDDMDEKRIEDLAYLNSGIEKLSPIDK